ncbi:hypothetical protein E5A73_09280 [Sphingomonas gei]|uniref:DUF1579 domain-containing protein n=2 Tax=Sphingomonas gei TaxID=1395960 RepID=A0A4S1XD75_9SPHN|nr:hypothetical protein E5A73_09280 [Sphingomonas gei]
MPIRPSARTRTPPHFSIALALAALSFPPHAASAQATPPAAAAARDGSHDFDWEIGSWTTELRYLPEPLTGSTRWVEYRGTTEVRALLGRRANIVELSVSGAAGRIEGVSLRLYNPQARQWTLNFASVRNGILTPPVTGAFDGKGRGTFYGLDTVGGRTVLVRFVISEVTARSARFEQASSPDGGATWEVNWIAVDTRD